MFVFSLSINMINGNHTTGSQMICLFCFYESYYHPCLTHAGHIGTDRSLLTGHNALLLQQIARDLLHASLHRHDDTWTAFFEPVVGTGGNSSIAL